LAQPPLFRIDYAKQTHWALDDQEKDAVLKKLPKNAKPDISRFKGLGEMPAEDLKATTLDPKRRRVLKVELDPGTEEAIKTLMGKDAAPRFRMIMDRAPTASLAELDV
jgi:DNA gyrase subunit B